MSRVFSMTEVAIPVGTILGPVIGGFLKEVFGYTYMCWTWSKSACDVPFDLKIANLVRFLVLCFSYSGNVLLRGKE